MNLLSSNRARILSIIAIASAFARPLSGQEDVRRIVVGSDVACKQCSVAVQRVARLGGPEGLGGFSRIVERDSRGRYYVVDKMTAANEIFVFDAKGTYLQTIGKKGAGPGEYRGIAQVMILPGDTLRVEDLRNGRYTIYSPEYAIVRSGQFRTDFMPRVRFADGRVVTSRMDPSKDRVGFPLHLLASDGTVLRSFGADQPVYREGTEQMLIRVLAPAAGGRFYAAHSQEYVIEKWDTLGHKVREITRAASWFKPWVSQPMTSPDGPARQPRILSVREDEHERLWVLTQVAQPDWKKYLSQAAGRDGEAGGGWIIGGVTKNTGYDTMVEVIDLKTGRLLVSQRLDQAMWKMFEGGLAYSDGEDEQLASYVDIWRLQLIQP